MWASTCIPKSSSVSASTTSFTNPPVSPIARARPTRLISCLPTLTFRHAVAAARAALSGRRQGFCTNRGEMPGILGNLLTFK